MRSLKPDLSIDDVSQHHVVHFLKIFVTRSPTVPKRYNNSEGCVREVVTLWGVQWSDLVISIGLLRRPKGSVSN